MLKTLSLKQLEPHARHQIRPKPVAILLALMTAGLESDISRPDYFASP
jgi:hypothetical protein